MKDYLHHRSFDSDAVLIHAFAVAAAGIGAGLSPVPGADAAALVTLQTAMVQALARRHGADPSIAAAAELVLSLLATVTGRAISAFLLARVPVVGVVVNAATAASVTEAVGWAALRYFRAEEQERGT